MLSFHVKTVTMAILTTHPTFQKCHQWFQPSNHERLIIHVCVLLTLFYILAGDNTMELDLILMKDNHRPDGSKTQANNFTVLRNITVTSQYVCVVLQYFNLRFWLKQQWRIEGPVGVSRYKFFPVSWTKYCIEGVSIAIDESVFPILINHHALKT